MVAVLTVGAAMAQDAPPTGRLGAVFGGWARALDSIERYINDADHSAARTDAYRRLAEKIGAEAMDVQRARETSLAATTELLEALGPAPAEDAPPEDEAVASQRAKLVDEVARLRGGISLSSLVTARAAALKKAITSSERQTIADRFLMRQPSPLSPDAIAVAAPDLFDHVMSLLHSPIVWYDSLTPERRERFSFERFLFVALIAAIIGWLIRHLLLRRCGRDPTITDPSVTRQLVAAVAEGIARGIVPALIVAGFLYQSLQPSALISGLFAQTFQSLCIALIFFILTTGLTQAVLSPDLPSWRITRLTAECARRLSRRIVLLAAVTAIDRVLQLSGDGMRTAGDLTPFYEFIANSAEALCILSLTPAHLWQFEAADTDSEASAEPSAAWRLIRRAAGAAAIAGIIAIAIGYADLGNFIVKTLLLGGTAFGALYLIRGLLRELVGIFMRSAFMRDQMAIGHVARQALKFWARVGLDGLLIALGAYYVAFWWGARIEEMMSWTADTLFGFTIGNVTISFVDIAFSIIVFVMVLAATRLIQRLLSEKVLPQTRLHHSVQHSISAAMGYVGLVIAIAASFAALGFDLTNLALIAGALSVGIGFGLQNVVNNFVSGIILLVERPIKVGDWISVAGHEGYVRKINVRAIEMQTFQRAAVIIPNAELLSGPVVNWTHKDRLGRVEIKVGVAYGSDTEKVRDILLDCAKAQDGLLAHPEPFVLFQDFGGSSLDFELRGFLRDVEEIFRVASDLRFAIDKAFREAGIEIPFLQTDIHLRDMDRLEAALAGRAQLAADAIS